MDHFKDMHGVHVLKILYILASHTLQRHMGYIHLLRILHYSHTCMHVWFSDKSYVQKISFMALYSIINMHDTFLYYNVTSVHSHSVCVVYTCVHPYLYR